MAKLTVKLTSKLSLKLTPPTLIPALIFVLISLLLLFPAAAQPATPSRPAPSQPAVLSEVSDISQLPLKEVIQEAKNIDPSQFPEIPPQIPFLGSNENVNFHIRMSDGSETVLGVKLRDRKVAEITDQLDDWTLRVEIGEETIKQITASETPLKELRNALKSKEIKIQGRTFTKKVKATFLRMGLKLSGLFSG